MPTVQLSASYLTAMVDVLGDVGQEFRMKEYVGLRASRLERED